MPDFQRKETQTRAGAGVITWFFALWAAAVRERHLEKVLYKGAAILATWMKCEDPAAAADHMASITVSIGFTGGG